MTIYLQMKQGYIYRIDITVPVFNTQVAKHPASNNTLPSQLLHLQNLFWLLDGKKPSDARVRYELRFLKEHLYVTM